MMFTSQMGREFDGNNQKRKTLEVGTLHFKIGRKKSL
ncbi:hypothetical protein Goari_022710, partial [Gossypium aridum]|nr:hypothetical protein [Gossypium aridum]